MTWQKKENWTLAAKGHDVTQTSTYLWTVHCVISGKKIHKIFWKSFECIWFMEGSILWLSLPAIECSGPRLKITLDLSGPLFWKIAYISTLWFGCDCLEGEQLLSSPNLHSLWIILQQKFFFPECRERKVSFGSFVTCGD